MRYIHPFPARMAPEIILDRIQDYKKGSKILDPMTGSGMVVAHAARRGIKGIGVDLDPLANLISRVGATPVDESEARRALDALIKACRQRGGKYRLPWIDDDQETLEFAEFWFYPKQIRQLRKLSYFLITEPIGFDPGILDVLKVSLSRLIITKEPKASLARDTAHSRPHRTIIENDFDIFDSLPKSLTHVLAALDVQTLQMAPDVHLGDARNLSMIRGGSIDGIITSPPYLNAIDYMRGHRLSLIWLGYQLKELREIRATSIGAEKAATESATRDFHTLEKELNLENLTRRNKSMLERYFSDLIAQTQEARRVLKRGAVATYVIGNSNCRGVYIRNSEILKRAGELAGLALVSDIQREIPMNRRYMPLPKEGTNSLAARMRTEHIIEFRKT